MNKRILSILALLLIAVSGAWADVDYYVVGTFNNWTPSDSYKMTYNETQQCYLLTMSFTAGDELKVQDSDGTWYPDGVDNNYQVTVSGTQTVFFSLNAEGMGWYADHILVEEWIPEEGSGSNTPDDEEDGTVNVSGKVWKPGDVFNIGKAWFLAYDQDNTSLFHAYGEYYYAVPEFTYMDNQWVTGDSFIPFDRYFDEGQIVEMFQDAYLRFTPLAGKTESNVPVGFTVKSGTGKYADPYVFGLVYDDAQTGGDEPVISADGKTATFVALDEDMVVEYELVRDMEYEVGIPTPAERIMIQLKNGDYALANESDLSYAAVDNIDNGASAMTLNIDYEAVLQKLEDGVWTPVSELSQGTFRVAFTGVGLYDGIIYTQQFELFAGYEVAVRAHEFVTYHHNEALATNDEGAHLYTVTQVDEAAATATIGAIEEADMYMPFLVYNSTDEDKVFLLVPTGKLDCNQTFAQEFVGTDTPETLYGAYGTYYTLNGRQFVRVRDELIIPAHRCWLSIGHNYSSAAALRLVFEGEAETGIETLDNDNKATAPVYDLNGRKVVNPSQPGVYIESNRKQLRVK
ncbi:MAG: hypothetical protein E7070_03255 [Bacteroidales bacterium]|nr:hypothetical protein [Bacteroidales bacterium]